MSRTAWQWFSTYQQSRLNDRWHRCVLIKVETLLLQLPESLISILLLLLALFVSSTADHPSQLLTHVIQLPWRLCHLPPASSPSLIVCFCLRRCCMLSTCHAAPQSSPCTARASCREWRSLACPVWARPSVGDSATWESSQDTCWISSAWLKRATWYNMTSRARAISARGRRSRLPSASTASRKTRVVPRGEEVLSSTSALLQQAARSFQGSSCRTRCSMSVLLISRPFWDRISITSLRHTRKQRPRQLHRRLPKAPWPPAVRDAHARLMMKRGTKRRAADAANRSAPTESVTRSSRMARQRTTWHRKWPQSARRLGWPPSSAAFAASYTGEISIAGSQSLTRDARRELPQGRAARGESPSKTTQCPSSPRTPPHSPAVRSKAPSHWRRSSSSAAVRLYLRPSP